MHFLEWSGEPVKVIERKIDNTKKEITFTCVFLNKPYEYYARDETPPIAVTLVSLIPTGAGGMSIEWTQSDEADHLGYKVYFATTIGEWESESCNSYGTSPLDIKNPVIVDDNATLTIYGLSLGITYYFKIVSYDTSYNDSLDSNIVSQATYSSAANKYYVQGVDSTGLTLDSQNNAQGTAPTGFTVYGPGSLFGTATYEYTAAYESSLIENITEISWTGTGDVWFQWRSYDGTTYSSWTAVSDASGDHEQAVSGDYVQYRFLWSSVLWSLPDSIIITGIE